ncbi:uncharacterized protein B0J16DRAFT_387016 [Fusarium flagelliforme]|uniref:Uncharacterized protein n=1 Tax=Fusarium flagelliforme TaxID=2675880 RepID=A0A395MEF6_9HYPO|nr:uncharacterized protein B0J16DRAFT_387016 [Fusarium flagelliforme]KAH7179184.1 hypothetical protein B0J16DRAFT_387016 [Fusarium flagelliforme]RFN46307.1 hypothetical protein FIE12Z_9461 [Fusarium flagelliforme]
MTAKDSAVEIGDTEAWMTDLTKGYDYNFRLFNVDSESRHSTFNTTQNPPPAKIHQKKGSYELLDTSLMAYWRPLTERRGVWLGPEESHSCSSCDTCAPSEYTTEAQPECNRISPTDVAIAMPGPEMPNYERVNYEMALFNANMEELRQHRAFASELLHQDSQQIDLILEGKQPESREVNQKQLNSEGTSSVPRLTNQFFPQRSSDNSINVSSGGDTIHVATGGANGGPSKATTARVPKRPRVAKGNGSDPPKKRGRPRKHPLPEPKPLPESKPSQPTPDNHGKA